MKENHEHVEMWFLKGNHTSNAAFVGAELGKSGQGTSSPCLLSATAAGEATTV